MPLQNEKLRLLRRIPDIRFEEEPKGYSKDQVDRVLANLAPLGDEIERLQGRLKEAEDRADGAESRLVEARSPAADQAVPVGAPVATAPDFDETLRNTLVSAQRQADTTIREAQEEAERLRTEAEFQTNALLADARDQAADTTAEAVEYRERLMGEAAEEKARLLEEAKAEANTRVKSVEKELADAHETERSKLISQITELKGTHELLQGDVTRFEDHLQSRCAEVKLAVEQISAAVEDPATLRAGETIEPEVVESFDEEDYSEISVELGSLEELENEAAEAAKAAPEKGAPIDISEFEGLSSAEGAAESAAEAVTVSLDDGLVEDNGGQAQAPPKQQAQQQVQQQQQQQAQQQQQPASQQQGQQQQQQSQQAKAAQNKQTGKSGTGKSGDPFLDELKRVTTEDAKGDAISDFLDDADEEAKGSGWFGRRK